MRYQHHGNELNNEEDIIGFEALFESMQKCKKGVMWKGSAAHYVLNGLEETEYISGVSMIMQSIRQ